MRQIVFGVMSAALLARSASAQQLTGSAKWADSASRMIEASVIGDATNGLDSALVLLDRALTVTPDDYLLLHYSGYTLYRQANTSVRNQAKDLAITQFQQADSLLQRSAKLHALPETYALLASVAGHLAALDPSHAETHGMASNDFGSRAAKLGPSNPRVALLRGTGALYGPPEYTGGPKEAERQLQRAHDLFAQDAPGAPLPSWGRAETSGYLALARHALGNDVGARVAAEEALKLAPNYKFVRYKILPMLDKPSA